MQGSGYSVGRRGVIGIESAETRHILRAGEVHMAVGGAPPEATAKLPLRRPSGKPTEWPESATERWPFQDTLTLPKTAFYCDRLATVNSMEGQCLRFQKDSSTPKSTST
jgi:hypothetical protein